MVAKLARIVKHVMPNKSIELDENVDKTTSNWLAQVSLGCVWVYASLWRLCGCTVVQHCAVLWRSVYLLLPRDLDVQQLCYTPPHGQLQSLVAWPVYLWSCTIID